MADGEHGHKPEAQKKRRLQDVHPNCPAHPTEKNAHCYHDSDNGAAERVRNDGI